MCAGAADRRGGVTADGEPEARPASVVWWKTSVGLAEIPRRHRIGWADVTGMPAGTLTITSPHPRLDRRTIEAHLVDEVGTAYAAPPTLGTVAELDKELSPEARVRAAGHSVLTRDLRSVYGEEAVGGIVATLLGKGVNAYVLIDHDATTATRTAVCQAALDALDTFSTATPADLYAGGWERGGEERWQLLLQRR